MSETPGDPADPHARVQDPAEFIGLYPLGPIFAIAVTAKDGVLHAQHTNQLSRQLRRIAPDRFTLVDSSVPSEITFERDAAGAITGLTLNQNGLERRGPRRALPVWPNEVVLPAEVLREYVGTYPRAPGVALIITEENGRLFTETRSQSGAPAPAPPPKFPLYASARDEFFYKITDSWLSFERDATGHVTGFVLHQRMRKLP